MPAAKKQAFTLIELLVVIAIIALLVGILLPALSAAREQAKLATCANQLRELTTAFYAYAGDYDNGIPRGPHTTADNPVGPYYWDQIATNQIWIKDQSPVLAAQYNAHGVLMQGYLQDLKAMYCPGDDSIDPTQEFARVGDPTNNAYSSYLYRQLDETSLQRIDDLGVNSQGRFGPHVGHGSQ